MSGSAELRIRHAVFSRERVLHQHIVTVDGALELAQMRQKTRFEQHQTQAARSERQVRELTAEQREQRAAQHTTRPAGVV